MCVVGVAERGIKVRIKQDASEDLHNAARPTGPRELSQHCEWQLFPAGQVTETDRRPTPKGGFDAVTGEFTVSLRLHHRCLSVHSYTQAAFEHEE